MRRQRIIVRLTSENAPAPKILYELNPRNKQAKDLGAAVFRIFSRYCAFDSSTTFYAFDDYCERGFQEGLIFKKIGKEGSTRHIAWRAHIETAKAAKRGYQRKHSANDSTQLNSTIYQHPRRRREDNKHSAKDSTQHLAASLTKKRGE